MSRALHGPGGLRAAAGPEILRLKKSQWAGPGRHETARHLFTHGQFFTELIRFNNT